MNKASFIALVFTFFCINKLISQDVIFNQWELIPVQFNPALTGNFDGTFSIRAKYRDQWSSILGDDSYKTSAISAEYKFSKENARKLSIGYLSIFDQSGEAGLSTETYNLSASIIQHFGNMQDSHHSLAFGFNFGIANRKIDIENIQWPGELPENINSKVNFADMSIGLNWRYRSKSHFSYSLGSSLQHFNKPNVSFFNGGNQNLQPRINFHGDIEIPVAARFSFMPSFLFYTQGPSNRVQFGFYNKWYTNTKLNNFVQLGFFGKASERHSGTEINMYVISTTLQLNNISLGISVDKHISFGGTSIEFSLGYIIN